MTTAIAVGKERPILFTSEMVSAVLDGRKTQTRRVIQHEFTSNHNSPWLRTDGLWQWQTGKVNYEDDAIRCPYGKAEDRLWVKETFGIPEAPYQEKVKELVAYRADQSATLRELNKHFWRSARFMPRWASRLVLEVVRVRVERIQQISNGDANAEGRGIGWGEGCFHRSFRGLWDSINAKRGFGWDANPWVWVIEFRRIESAEQWVQRIQKEFPLKDMHR